MGQVSVGLRHMFQLFVAFRPCGTQHNKAASAHLLRDCHASVIGLKRYRRPELLPGFLPALSLSLRLQLICLIRLEHTGRASEHLQLLCTQTAFLRCSYCLVVIPRAYYLPCLLDHGRVEFIVLRPTLCIHLAPLLTLSLYLVLATSPARKTCLCRVNTWCVFQLFH